MATENEYSFNSIRSDIEENKESTIFFSPFEDKYTEVNFDTSLREQVSANTANIAKHESFISENSDIKNVIEDLELKIEGFDNLSYVVHEDFDGNITNMDVVDDLEKIVNDLKYTVYQLVRDYGTHLNTGDLKYQNQLATETLEELDKLITDSQQNLIPIREVVTEVREARENYFSDEISYSLKQRLINDFKAISDRLEELSEFDEFRNMILEIQNQIDDIIENGVRQDIIDDIYAEIDKIKEDIEWLKENGGGGGTGPKPEADLPDAGIIQQCLNVFLITNTTLFRMRGVVEENNDLVDYITFQITQGNISKEKIFKCYPYLEQKINEKLTDMAIRKYNLNRQMVDSMSITELAEVCADEIVKETDTEKLNRCIQTALNVFIETNSTAVRTQEVKEEEHGLVDYIAYQVVNNRMDRDKVCDEYKHLESEIIEKIIELGGE